MQCNALVTDGSTRCPAHKVRAGSFADSRRGSRQSRGYGRQWDVTRERILSRDCGLCQPCLRINLTTLATQVDHIVPKAAGGHEGDANLQAICTPCHRAKTALEGRHAPPRPTAAASDARPTPPGGGEKSGGAAGRTGRLAKFLRAQVSGVGGVNSDEEMAPAAVGGVA